jgi:endonuclease I
MKKILWMATIILSAFILFSCEAEEIPTYNTQQIIDALEIEYQEGDSKNHVTGSVVFPLTSPLDVKIKISWGSDQPSIIDFFGTVNRPNDDTTVNVTYTVDNYGSKFSGVITFTVIGDKDTIDPVLSGYTVNYYYENIYDDDYTLVDSINIEDYVGENVFVNPENVEGFIINNASSITTGMVTDDEILTLSVYYERITYRVSLYDGDELIDELTLKHGYVLSLEDPLKEDYEFLEWRKQNEVTAYDLSTPVTSDFTLKAIFKAIDDSYTYTGYYEGADGLEGEQLVIFLNQLINSTFDGVTYGDARYMLDETDRDPNQSGNIILIYLGTSVSGVWDSGNTWNREHIWPQSLLGVSADNSTVNSASDLHNLKPSNPAENSSRGNKFFGNSTTSETYEPRDEVKGDIARILFYMDIMYDELSLIVANEGNTYQMGNLDALLAWHTEDPVDDFEMYRNQKIEAFQGNRNPFIDHPEFVDKIYGNTQTTSIDEVTYMFGSMIESIYDV